MVQLDAVIQHLAVNHYPSFGLWKQCSESVHQPIRFVLLKFAPRY